MEKEYVFQMRHDIKDHFGMMVNKNQTKLFVFKITVVSGDVCVSLSR